MIDKLCTTLEPDERASLAVVYRDAAHLYDGIARTLAPDYGKTPAWTAAATQAYDYRRMAHELDPLQD